MRVVRTSVLAFVAAFGSSAQKPSLRFEVASIKASAPGGSLGTIYPAPGRQRYVGTNVSLKLMMTVAYRVNFEQISGPDWISDELFDVNAQAEQPATIEELHVMLRNMVVDRFRLRMHIETKTRAIYVLSADQGGVKLKPSETEGDPQVSQPAQWTLAARSTRMNYFSWLLGLFVDRPIVDRTGLKNAYDFTLSWNPELSAETSSENPAPGLFEAVKKELGLRLDPQNGPLEILVVDHAERPEPN